VAFVAQGSLIGFEGSTQMAKAKKKGKGSAGRKKATRKTPKRKTPGRRLTRSEPPPTQHD